MAYSEDLRNRVRRYIADGGAPSEAVKVFAVSRTSIYRWCIDPSPRKKPGRKGPDKLDETALLADVKAHPDKLLKERAETFGMSVNGIWVALKRLGVKKNTKIH